MHRFILLFYVGLFFVFGHAQTISGRFSQLPNRTLKLEGFLGFKTYPISSVVTDEQGNFRMNYNMEDYGVGYLIAADHNPFLVILSGENIEIVGTSLNEKENLVILKGQENQWFEQYAKEHPRREQAFSAWLYLEKMYMNDSLFAKQQISKQAILLEKGRIQREGAAFLSALPKDSYTRWYLPMRKLVSEVPLLAQYRTDEIPATITEFRRLDYTDARLYKSGLFRDAIESHFWLLENSSMGLDVVYTEMKASIDAMMVHLEKDNLKLNEVTIYLFDLLERNSLFRAAEYLAIKVLNATGCTLDASLAKQLETYRTMKKGNIAPDILFAHGDMSPGFGEGKVPQKLSALQSKYTLVVFGAGWCPKCKEELPEIAKHYQKWKTNDFEVVLVSLDETPETFREFVKEFPFLAICDYKKWDGKIVNDYYVFATPTMFLLDANLRIILRPNSVNQMDAWVDWYLVQGNFN
jgi:thiol-disulfide isomerase/thioredoxin